MLKNWIRVFKNDNGAITDLTLDNENNGVNMAFPIVAAEDEIIIGKFYPFNNLELLVSTANTNASVMAIQYWATNEWVSAVDILDGTSSSGVSLGQSGGVQFSPITAKRWTRTVDTSDTSNTPPELQTETIYNLYFLKIKFSADLSAGTELKRIFYKFTDEQAMSGLDMELTKYKTTFGVTDWEQQIFTASKELLIDLKSRSLVQNEGQLLRLEDVYLPCAYRALAIIYFNLGDDYTDKRSEAFKMYNDLMKPDNFTVDLNANGQIDENEIDVTVRRLVRS